MSCFETATDADGGYDVTGLPAGVYTVAIDDAAIPSDLIVTLRPAATIALGEGESITDVDFAAAPAVDLAIGIVPDATTVQAGDEVVWTVTVVNSGPGDETGPIEVMLQLGDGLTLLSCGEGDSCDPWTIEDLGGGLFRITFPGGLPNGDSLTFPITTRVEAVTGDLSVAVAVSGSSVDLDMSNNAVTVVVGNLPFTGMDTDRYVRFGLALLAAGALLLLVGRRREDEPASG